MQLIILCSEVIVNCLKNPDADAKNFLVLEDGNEEFISAEGKDANSSESDENEEGDEGSGGLRH